MREPVLIDDLLARRHFFTQNRVELDGEWFCAKPLPYYGWHNIAMRFYHAWLVLRGKAMAFQYAEDRAAQRWEEG